MNYRISLNIQGDIQDRIDAFCDKEFPGCPCEHIADIRGKFIYIKRLFPCGTIEPVCRLTYEDDLENMEFAIFKFSTERIVLMNYSFLEQNVWMEQSKERFVQECMHIQ